MNEKAKFIEITEEQKGKINKIRLSFSDIYNCIEKLCENSREKSLVITKLEEELNIIVTDENLAELEEMYGEIPEKLEEVEL